MLRWRLYYSDGSTFDDTQGTPADAPAYGVVVVLQRHDSLHWPRTVVQRFDWYWWRPDEGVWYGGDTYGFFDQACRCGAVWPKQGRAVSNDRFAELMHIATHDADFPDAGRSVAL